jgi:hypothetical protein
MDSQGVEMLLLIGGLCCLGFIKSIVFFFAGLRRQRIVISVGPT